MTILIALIAVAVLALLVVARTIRIVPQAGAGGKVPVSLVNDRPLR